MVHSGKLLLVGPCWVFSDIYDAHEHHDSHLFLSSAANRFLLQAQPIKRRPEICPGLKHYIIFRVLNIRLLKQEPLNFMLESGLTILSGILKDLTEISDKPHVLAFHMQCMFSF